MDDNYMHDYKRAQPSQPSQLNTNAWEMVDIDGPSEKQRLPPPPYPDTDPAVTPYLGLRARLSQVWFNRWTVLLVLVLIRMLILTGGLNDNLDNAKAQSLAACSKVEDVGSAVASMPHYLSVGVNNLAASGVNHAVSAMAQVIMMILTGVQELIFFIINMYVGTYVCLASALIHGGLELATAVVQEATDVMNSAISSITNGITKDIASVQDVINSASNGVSGVAGFFGSNISPPKIDITSHLNDLKNIHIDGTKAVEGITSLNKTIPNFDQAENITKNAIGIPFNLVKQMVNASFSSYQFDRTVFPVAEKKALSFCSDNSFLNDFFNTLFELVNKAKIAFFVAIPILAILAMVAMGAIEVRRWRRERKRAKFFVEHGYDPMDIIYSASRPFTATLGIKLSSRLQGRRKLWARWAMAYATSLPALFVLSLALAGLLSCFCQWIVLRLIEKEAPALASQVGDFAGDVVNTLQDVSTDWAVDANRVMVKTQNDINDDLFGWVLNATTAVNNTLNAFDDEISKGITTIFHGTPLEQPARDIVNCLITRKVETVQKGLTWVHDSAHITLPLFQNDTFSQGANDSVNGDSDLKSFLATPATVTTDELSGAVDKVVTALRNGIVQELLISLGLLLVYVIIVLSGVIRSLCGMMGPEKTRGEGGQRYGEDMGQEANPYPENSHPEDSHPENPFREGAYPDPSSYPEANPYEEDVVYAGTVPQGKAGLGRYPSHARKSSYPDEQGHAF
ncbi:plasma membrane fusion protein PRM1 [Lasiosphaeria ovina]|uniref:Plasma membrane fusion protein PRM1 n=1 Tax=Lasiosphaeria ovina TaxID=92902 RepID=A0AAE0N695_9PEZI|nr:plasma membrane fusion protein PRM1 [Lasiosphaeria ovina]